MGRKLDKDAMTGVNIGFIILVLAAIAVVWHITKDLDERDDCEARGGKIVKIHGHGSWFCEEH